MRGWRATHDVLPPVHRDDGHFRTDDGGSDLSGTGKSPPGDEKKTNEIDRKRRQHAATQECIDGARESADLNDEPGLEGCHWTDLVEFHIVQPQLTELVEAARIIGTSVHWTEIADLDFDFPGYDAYVGERGKQILIHFIEVGDDSYPDEDDYPEVQRLMDEWEEQIDKEEEELNARDHDKAVDG